MFEVNLTSGTEDHYKEAGFVNTWYYPVLVIYHVLITLSALIGNPVILYGSFKYNALNVEEISVVFIKCLAVTDILILLSSAIPILTTLLARSWVLGPVVCFIHSFLIFVPGISQNIIILMISCYKLRYIMRPFSGPLSPSAVRNSILLVYLFALIYTVIAIFLTENAEFSLPDLSCIPSLNNSRIKVYSTVGILLLNFLPSVIMFVVNVLLLLLAHAANQRHGDTLSLKSLVFISAIAWIYIVSSIPKGIRYILQGLGRDPPLWLAVFQKEIYFLNISCNWLVYTVTNRDFRTFLRRFASRKLKDPSKVGSRSPISEVTMNTISTVRRTSIQ